MLGSLTPGSSIIESRLATAVRISRTPLREALLCLEQEVRLAIWCYEYRYISDVNLIANSVSQHRAIMNAIAKRNLPALLNGIEVSYEFGMQVLLREMGES